MKYAIIVLLSLVASSAFAGELRIYQTDKYGRIQYSKPSYTIRADGRIIQTDAYGNKQYSKQQYQITGNKIVPVSAIGYRQYNKPAFVFESKR